jgi:DNA-binding response OmpR family regulator
VIDRDIHLARALLVEGNALLRSVAAAQLRDAGVGHVASASRVKEARLMIEREPFDIVICNREFEGCADNGQDLLDELRRENQLPHSTVFMMVTAKASYHEVVEAAEAALDGILLRPYSGALLAERLMEARHRKRELAPILSALDGGEIELAMARALKRFQGKQPYATYCGRLVAELLLRMGRAREAHKMFERLAQPKNAVWARLGMARADMAAGESQQARRTIAGVLADEPGSADAHDLIGRILVEQCDFDGALAEYRRAAELTPGCLLRAQHAGALAFYQAQGPDALSLLERTLGLGVQSKLFDALSLLLVAILRFDNGDAPGVASMLEQLARYHERFPGSRRLARFGQAAEVLVSLQGGAQESAGRTLGALAQQVGEDDFDLEAANVLLALSARMPPGLLPAAGQDALIDRIAMRFCVSKAMTEVLVASARREEPAHTLIRRAQARVAALAEQAMETSLSGDPAGAAAQLLEAGEESLNAKLLEMAGQIARRHANAVPNAQALITRATALLRRSCRAMNHIAGIQRSGRSPGGLQLRVRAEDRTDVATA